MTDAECEAYLVGYLRDMDAYSWMRDGFLVVGGAESRLSEEIENAKAGRSYMMKPEVRKYLQRKERLRLRLETLGKDKGEHGQGNN